jgi:peptidoglycan/LPS O-acetylase OafA/YrhL
MQQANRIDWLDYARFICALAVVCFHYMSPGISNHMPFMPDLGLIRRVADYGYLGVDFFFMVSGYVIMLSVGDRAASDFAAARVLRLYPAYLFCMTLTWLVLAIARDTSYPVTALQWAANLTMVSHVFGIPYVDTVYWTLLYEISFYAMVYALIFFGARRKLEICAMIWLALQVAAWATGVNVPLVSGYFLLFSAGCLLYFATREGWTMLRAGAVLVALLLNLGGIMERGALRTEMSGIALNPAVLLTVMVTFFAAFVILPRLSLRLPYAKVIGSLTYPLYLVHQHIGYVLIGGMVAYVSPGLAVALIITLMIAVALFVAEIVERKPRATYALLVDHLIAPLRWLEAALIARLRVSRP